MLRRWWLCRLTWEKPIENEADTWRIMMVEKETLKTIATLDHSQVRMEAEIPYFFERFAQMVRPTSLDPHGSRLQSRYFQQLNNGRAFHRTQKAMARQAPTRQKPRILAGTCSPHRTRKFDTDRFPVIGEVRVSVPGTCHAFG